jgi:hypothetical protein
MQKLRQMKVDDIVTDYNLVRQITHAEPRTVLKKATAASTFLNAEEYFDIETNHTLNERKEIYTSMIMSKRKMDPEENEDEVVELLDLVGSSDEDSAPPPRQQSATIAPKVIPHATSTATPTKRQQSHLPSQAPTLRLPTTRRTPPSLLLPRRVLLFQ